MPAAFRYILDHWELFSGAFVAIAGLIAGVALRADRAALAKLEGSNLFHAHPDLIPWLERGNMLVLKACKIVYAVTLTDLDKAKTPNEDTAREIGNDVVTQLGATFGAKNLAVAQKAALALGSTLQSHFAEQAQKFFDAPSGAPVVRAAPLPDPQPPKVA